MTNENLGAEVSTTDLRRLRAEIENLTRQLPGIVRFRISQLSEHVNTLGGYSISENQIRYLQQSQLLEPKKDERGYFVYSRDDLRDLLLICRLNQVYDIPYARVGGYLLGEARDKLREWRESNSAGGSIPSPDQPRRALLFWRSHLGMVLLAWLFGGTVPSYARILIRRQSIPSWPVNRSEPSVEVHKWEFLKADNILSHPRQEDLTLITTEDHEVLHKAIEWDDWRRCHNLSFNWYYGEVGSPQTSTIYYLVIALPKGSIVLDDRRSWSSEEAALFCNLLAALFLEASSTSPEDKDLGQISTRLDTIVNLIPNLSPKWQYSAVLTPSPRNPQQLAIAAISSTFRSKARRNVLIIQDQPLSGWAFRQNQCMVVQRTIGLEDPRISYQMDEGATAAAAIPTSINGRRNGVLYIGTQQPVDGDAFSEAEIQFLRLLGRIVGELIEIERMRLDIGQDAVRIIAEPSLKKLGWKQLADDVGQIADAFARDRNLERAADSLHFLVVRIGNYADLERHSEQVAEWSANQARLMAFRYYLDHQMGVPTLYDRAPDRFVLLLRRTSMDDESERTFRRKVHEYLNSTSLAFDQGTQPVTIQCDLWSLPFRYAELGARLGEGESRVRAVVDRLLQTVQRSFDVLSLFHKAHDFEKIGAHEKALEFYERARVVDPENVYIWRHIAKTRTNLGDYGGAVREWLQVIIADKHPSHYRRLAFNLACLGELDQAAMYCDKAAELDDKAPQCYAEWGSVLYQLGQRDEDAGRYEEAQARYKDAAGKLSRAALLDQNERNRVAWLLRIAEVRLALKEYRDALSACNQALTYEPNNPMIPFWIMKIRRAMESSAQGSVDSGNPPHASAELSCQSDGVLKR